MTIVILVVTFIIELTQLELLRRLLALRQSVRVVSDILFRHWLLYTTYEILWFIQTDNVYNAVFLQLIK